MVGIMLSLQPLLHKVGGRFLPLTRGRSHRTIKGSQSLPLPQRRKQLEGQWERKLTWVVGGGRRGKEEKYGQIKGRHGDLSKKRKTERYLQGKPPDFVEKREKRTTQFWIQKPGSTWQEEGGLIKGRSGKG